MIVVDVNLLIYAVNRDAPHHSRAKAWLETALMSSELLALPSIVLLAFLRLTTRLGVFSTPLSVDAALKLIDAWLEQPAVRVIHPGPGHFSILRDLLLSSGTGGNLTSDGHLAALAIEHGAEVCSLDSDFSRFAKLRWRNPLA